MKTQKKTTWDYAAIAALVCHRLASDQRLYMYKQTDPGNERVMIARHNYRPLFYGFGFAQKILENIHEINMLTSRVQIAFRGFDISFNLRELSHIEIGGF